MFQFHPLQRGEGQRRLVFDEPGFAFRLGDVHRDIGVADQVVGRLLAGNDAGNADAGPHGDFPAADGEWRRQLARDALGDPCGGLLVLEVAQEYREFITAQPSDGITWPQGA